MSCEIQFDDAAIEDLRVFTKHIRTTVFNAITEHLTHQPDLVSKSRIKRLQGMSRPQYRLRVDDYRVFYDVDEANHTVMIIAVVHKPDAQKWLDAEGTSNSSDEND